MNDAAIARIEARPFRFPAALLAAIATALVAGCASLPPLDGRHETRALADTSQTFLGRRIGVDAAAHPGLTGVHAIPEPHDAFAARMVLASVAERSLDAQYYIWHGDQVGYLLFEALWNAAQRGVRVRLLLDDANTKGLDATIAALDAHANIEVRLYNPLMERDRRLLNFVGDFSRVNRRMHNKSFTVDNQVSVVGGRNIGNEYFHAGGGVAFTDLDVIAAGDAVRQVSGEFDTYWNSVAAYPAATILGPAPPDAARELEARFAATRADPEAIAYLDAVRSTPMLRELTERTLAIEWTTARVLYDDPSKTQASATDEQLLFTQLAAAFGQAATSFDLISPYFIPGDGGTERLVALAKRGVKVRILTNSLASAEASVVHAGYSKRRADLLRAGIELYELKPVAGIARGGEKVPGPSVGTGLHAKTYAVDRSKIFIGSFNFDQRSAHLNTEMGMVIDSAALARRLAGAFDGPVRERAWQVRLAADGGLEWVDLAATPPAVYATEPETTWWRRLNTEMMSILPIDWLL